ncbi:DNA polymerase III subunit delta' [Altererythrobacter confluentis]|uniref:DNA polymerase III subunit delta n=1 Tax=Allopontixanthobacter confluentis TaxID=1849021 RepID=A0A6L7GF56_9SPHN|nr:DNA polymerase III subunit delta' [Allopontixanthobacter confluentis]MXP14106.1 DNA polymerase III subunit delta' [Allopontixanthobacter confluentis]
MSLSGHEEPWHQWREAQAGPRMHHAWLLAGKRGLGKMHFALAAARELVAETGVSQPQGQHPDIHILTHLPKDDKEERKREEGKPFELKRNISIAQIRAMQQRLNTRPTLGSRRAIIIDPSDDLEKGASNALLKSLEEPPQGTYFLLVAHRPARLLPTIRSRCRVLRFPTLSAAEMARIVAKEMPQADEATRKAAISAAGGAPGAALDFVSRDLGKLNLLMEQIAREGDPNFILRGRLADAMGARPDRGRVLASLDLARSVLGGMAADCRADQIEPMVEAHAELIALSGQAPTYNFDAGLLVMQIGTLLASAAGPRDRFNV